MRYVPVERLEEGMELVFGVYMSNGSAIAMENEKLDSSTIDLLKVHEVAGVYIEEDLTSTVTVSPIVYPIARQQAMLALKNADYVKCVAAAKTIVDELTRQDDVVLNYMDAKTLEDYPYAHSVNLAIISGVIGMNMKLERRRLRDLVLAALLANIGERQLDQKLVFKSEPLTAAEYITMRLHVKYSYQMLNSRPDLSYEAKVGILHHHENEDGTGYPDGLFGNEIPLFAKIIHVADVYDAMISKRPFRPHYTPKDAAKYLLGGVGMLFDKKVVNALIESIPDYPTGMDVLLSDGRWAVVFKNTKGRLDAPYIVTEDDRIIDLADPRFGDLEIKMRDEGVKDAETVENNRNDMITGKRNFRIMAVDDLTTNLQVLRGILEDEFELTLLKSGKQALNYLKNNPVPDLILMDINMPEIDGIETTRQIYKLTGGSVPVMFVSSNHDLATVLACKDVGCVGFIARPYNEVYIKEQVRKILTGEVD